jgi:hypothetical protein
VTAQLALVLDPVDELDMSHAEDTLAADTPPGRPAKRCRCTRPLKWGDNCAMCGHALPTTTCAAVQKGEP